MCPINTASLSLGSNSKSFFLPISDPFNITTIKRDFKTSYCKCTITLMRQQETMMISGCCHIFQKISQE